MSSDVCVLLHGSFIRKIQDFIGCHHLLNKDGLYLVALSGGADSVALLLAMKTLGYRTEAIHCNFHLRDKEADRDEAFCEKLCLQQNVPFHRVHFDTVAYSEAHHVSIEMAARELRYRYFEELRLSLTADDILVAHHRDDSLETFFINLIRGTGIHGLTGIEPRNGHIVRPLLCVSKKEITDFLLQCHQPYVTDSTNFIDDVQRNKIRLNILPMFETMNAAAKGNIASSINHLRQVGSIFDAIAQDLWGKAANRCANGDIVVDLAVLQHSAESLSIGSDCFVTFLLEWLRPFGFNATQTMEIAKAANKPGRIWQSELFILATDRRKLLIAPKASFALPSIRIPETGCYALITATLRLRIKVEVKSGGVLDIDKANSVCTLDADKVAFPLTVRTVTTGDRFCPFGMHGSRLVSDFLTDRKYSVFDKQRQLVVCDARGEILWLLGLRPDNRFRIDSETKNILKIAFTNDIGENA